MCHITYYVRTVIIYYVTSVVDTDVSSLCSEFVSFVNHKSFSKQCFSKINITNL